MFISLLARAILLASLQTTPADTGRMAYGHQDWKRYTTPPPCDRAVASETAESQRKHDRPAELPSVGLDTTSMLPVTLPPSAVAAAKHCAPQVAVATTARRDLWSLFRLLLARNDDSAASAVVQRQLRLVRSAANQGAVLLTAIQNGLAARPARLAAAQGWLRQMDVLGPSVRVSQYNGHLQLLEYWQTAYTPDSIRAHVTTLLRLLRPMTAEERDLIDASAPYEALLQLANDTNDVASAQSIIAREKRDISGWRGDGGAQMAADAEQLLAMQTTLYGKRTRALQGTYWFNIGGTPRPAPGSVSLLVHVDHTCGIRCYPLYALLRQIQSRYGDVALTLMTETHGWAIGTGVLPPAAEADTVSHYYLDFLKLPAALVVDRSPVSKKADGHVIHGISPIGSMFNGWKGVNAILVDRDATIRWIGMLRDETDLRRVSFVIERLSSSTSVH